MLTESQGLDSRNIIDAARWNMRLQFYTPRRRNMRPVFGYEVMMDAHNNSNIHNLSSYMITVFFTHLLR
jgi:hypothetical protein